MTMVLLMMSMSMPMAPMFTAITRIQAAHRARTPMSVMATLIMRRMVTMRGVVTVLLVFLLLFVLLMLVFQGIRSYGACNGTCDTAE